MPKEKATFFPCSPEQFADALTEALNQHARQTGEDDCASWKDHTGSTLLNMPSVSDGIKRIEHDWENWEWVDGYLKCKIVGIQSIGPLSFLGVTAGGDWETPVYSIFYFDGDKILRAYIPEKGNVYNFLAKSAFGNNDSDEKAAQMGWKKSYEDIHSYNEEKLLEDIRLHFGIKKGAQPADDTTAAAPKQKDWDNYQVDSKTFGVKTVRELTEAEAKDELCKAMDTIEAMRTRGDEISQIAEDWSKDEETEAN